MKLKTPNCPVCRKPAKGTLETVTGLALLQHNEDGTADYSGSTDIFWDEQKTVYTGGKATLLCPKGHDWLSEIEL